MQKRAQAAALAAGQATYHYDATLGKRDRDAAPKLKKLTLAVARGQASQAQQGLQYGQAIANGMSLTRELGDLPANVCRSEEHTSELQSLMRITYAVSCLK